MRLKLVLKVLVAVVAIALAVYVCLVAFGVYTALDIATAGYSARWRAM